MFESVECRHEWCDAKRVLCIDVRSILEQFKHDRPFAQVARRVKWRPFVIVLNIDVILKVSRW